MCNIYNLKVSGVCTVKERVGLILNGQHVVCVRNNCAESDWRAR